MSDLPFLLPLVWSSDADADGLCDRYPVFPDVHYALDEVRSLFLSS